MVGKEIYKSFYLSEMSLSQKQDSGQLGNVSQDRDCPHHLCFYKLMKSVEVRHVSLKNVNMVL
jgi:hypothetical protein